MTPDSSSPAANALPYDIAVAFVEAGASDPIPGMLEKIARGLGREVCAFWLRDEAAGVLRLEAAWRDPMTMNGGFLKHSLDRTLARGEDLPGRAWSARAPVFTKNIAADAVAPRADAAKAEGLKEGLAFPIIGHGRLLGVIEAYSTRLEAQEDLAPLAVSLGAEIGLFLDQRRADAATAAAVAHLKAVFDAATAVSIISTDPAGKITVFNKGAELMLGWTAEEMVGHRTPEIIHDAAEVAARGEELSREHGREIRGFQVFVETTAHEGHETRDWTYIRKDGRRFAVQLVVTAIRDADGYVVGYLGVASDISDRKRAEEEIARARDAALHAARVKADFLANMSHEIRTPMNAILGMTEVLLDSGLDEKRRGYAESVKRAADALLTLINDVLDASKMEAGKMSLERIPFDPNALAREALEMLGVAARAKGLALEMRPGAGVPARLLGDPARLRQILVNLLGNAVKFTEKGAVTIATEATKQKDGTIRLRLSVTDTGIGIPEASRLRIFQPFVQADASTTRQYGGTGLGLSISKQLVELMGGRIGVDSRVGAGSTFWCEIPLSIAPVPAAAATPAPAAKADAAQRRRYRVLVVDDNEVNRQVLSLQLARLGYQAAAAAGGAEALAALDPAGADLVFMDCQMPVMDGFEAVSLIRARQGGWARRPVIVAMTAHAMPGDREKCLAAGMDDYLAKPARAEDVAKMMARWDAPIDAAQTRELMNLAGREFPAMIAVFLANSEKLAGELAAAIAAGDLAAVQRACHNLRGSSGTFGARRLSSLCGEIEAAAIASRADALAEPSADLAEELARVRQAMEAL